jgi:hypothetical protein
MCFGRVEVASIGGRWSLNAMLWRRWDFENVRNIVDFSCCTSETAIDLKLLGLQ